MNDESNRRAKYDLEVLSLALENATCGAVIASTAITGEILFVNQEFTAITGYTLAHVPTVEAWLARAYPDEAYRAEVLSNWERDVSDPEREVSYRVGCLDGTQHEVLLRSALLPGERMIVTLLDLTGIRRFERDLVETESRLQQIADTIDQVFWIVQPEPYAVLYASPAFEEIWRRPIADLLADAELWSSAILDEDRPGVLEAWSRCMAGEATTLHVEYRIRRPDGEIRWMKDQGAAVQGGGVVRRINGIAKDITARKQAEQERRELEERVHFAQKMESLGVLAGGVAHDFNNLLMGILGGAELAMNYVPEGSKARHHLSGIEHAATRAAELARQLLAYSGKGRFVVERIDLNQIVEEMADLMEASVSKGTRILVEVDEAVPAVEADATQIRQVLMNLVTNASEAIGEAMGEIRIATGSSTCDTESADGIVGDDTCAICGCAYLEVTDDGRGMDEVTRARVFEPFFTTKFTGRGLGLAAVHGIVKGHSGAIRVQSEPGVGTSVRVFFPGMNPTIPEASHSVASHSVASPVPAVRGEGTILVCDDEEMVRDTTSAILELGGYRVVVTRDGREALELFQGRTDSIDCVLLDLTMPEMDGLETFRALRSIRPGIPVLLTSGYNEQDALTRFGGETPTGFIQKPYSSQRLLDELGRVMGP